MPFAKPQNRYERIYLAAVGVLVFVAVTCFGVGARSWAGTSLVIAALGVLFYGLRTLRR